MQEKFETLNHRQSEEEEAVATGLPWSGQVSHQLTGLVFDLLLSEEIRTKLHFFFLPTDLGYASFVRVRCCSQASESFLQFGDNKALSFSEKTNIPTGC